jgi:hypothetical protein
VSNASLPSIGRRSRARAVDLAEREDGRDDLVPTPRHLAVEMTAEIRRLAQAETEPGGPS